MEHRTKKLSVKLTPREFEALNQICDAMQMNKSVFIRKLIREYLKL